MKALTWGWNQLFVQDQLKQWWVPSLAAIKELSQRTDELQRKTAEADKLRTQVDQLRQANIEMERRIATLEQLMLGQIQVTQTPKLH